METPYKACNAHNIGSQDDVSVRIDNGQPSKLWFQETQIGQPHIVTILVGDDNRWQGVGP